MFEQASGGSPSVAGARNFSVPQVSAERRGDIASQGAPAPKRAGGFMQNRPPSFLETLKRVKENDPSLTVVDMSNSAAMQCKVSEYTTQLTDALKSNTQVKEVRLENCGIGDRECETLAEVLKANSVITFIDLQKNCVNNDGATALARGLAANTSVVEVSRPPSLLHHSRRAFLWLYPFWSPSARATCHRPSPPPSLHHSTDVARPYLQPPLLLPVCSATA